MMHTAPLATEKLTLKGNGLITGLPVTVTIEPGKANQGVVFYVQQKPDAESPATIAIPARLESVVNTERGVTLASPTGQTLSIVEHFLCAVALCGHCDLNVYVQGASELPLMDGSAKVWHEALVSHFGAKLHCSQADLELTQAVFFRLDDSVCVYALPASHYQVTYAVDYEHPDLKNQWIRWDSKEDKIEDILKARTYGYLRELPLLQARGLAKGVTLENTLGLTDEGGYTSALRIEREPLYHKVLDLTGDLMLSGINPLRLKAHIYALHGGHGGHIGFAKKLRKALNLA
ncbi:MAG: UDP-3-O-acyl-N-acetylglucosamine deacetylase [Vampirovibrionales bacterium]|nr:UDP-3-O-acyl-N-acetylglucosamine deacetylase [Vampirovibrionales bacterium]